MVKILLNTTFQDQNLLKGRKGQFGLEVKSLELKEFANAGGSQGGLLRRTDALGHPNLFTALEQPTTFFKICITMYHHYAYGNLHLWQCLRESYYFQ